MEVVQFYQAWKLSQMALTHHYQDQYLFMLIIVQKKEKKSKSLFLFT